jgi:hypothetical protein
MYAGGDVQHQSPVGVIDWANLTQTSRTLAQRDNLIAATVNSLVAQVNNKEQLIPVPIPNTYLSPGDSITVTNVRIPPGFEARVLNAAVASAPVANLALLQVLYNSTYGATTGQSVASTYNEVSVSTSFYPTGGLAIQISNGGQQGVTASGSVLITLRPVVDQPGSVIGPGSQGQPGPPGPPGQDGANGSPGVPGPTGATWTYRGPYNALASYNQNDVVAYNLGTPGVAAYIALVPNTGQQPPLPTAAPSAYWGLLAYTSPSTTPYTIAPSYAWGGLPILNLDWGYFQAPFTGQIVGAMTSIQTPPSGTGGDQIDIVNSSDARTYHTVYIPSGSYFSGTTFATPVSVAAGDYVRSRMTQIGGTSAGSHVNMTLIFQALT